MTDFITKTDTIVNANIHDFGKGDKDSDPNNNGSNGRGPGGSNNGSGSGSGGNPGGASPSGSGRPIGQHPSGNTSTEVGEEDLPLINYNERAKNKKFSKALFRDNEIEKLVGLLRTKKKPNGLLVGDAGVGKTQIVEELANRIVQNDPIVNKLLKDTVIYELPISQLVAGKSYVGQLEQSINDVISFASDPENHAILFIDEIHQLMSSRDSTSEKIAQILKPALGRGDLRVIGATTTSEATTFLKDPAFNRRFSRVLIPELTPEQTTDVVKAIRPSFQKHHDVTLPDNLIDQAIVLGDEYRQAGSHRPDTTITLIDRAMSDANIERAKLERQALTNPTIKQFINNNRTPVLNVKQLKKAGMELASGDSTHITNQVVRLKDNLDNKIIGQKEAKDELIDAIKRQQLNIVRRKQPVSFLFAGLTGTGKTELARQLADAMYGSRENMIYINMSEYSNDSALTRITGSSDGYIGSDSKRELPFDSLESKPYQIVLLDEFEKAAKNVQRFFMQALDNGRVQNNRGTDIDFSRTIVIATTNAGVDNLSEKTIGFGNTGVLADKATKNDILSALQSSFDIELLNRFEKVVSFTSLSKDDYKKILAVKYNGIIAEAQENRQDLLFSPLHIDLDDAENFDFINELSEESYQPNLNGRPAERTMRNHIQDVLLDNPSQTQFDFK